jgi:hypothetical protein
VVLLVGVVPPGLQLYVAPPVVLVPVNTAVVLVHVIVELVLAVAVGNAVFEGTAMTEAVEQLPTEAVMV